MAKKAAKKSVKSAAKKPPAKKAAKASKSKTKVVKKASAKAPKASKVVAKTASRAKAAKSRTAKSAPRGPVKATKAIEKSRGPRKQAPKNAPLTALATEQEVRAELSQAEQAPQSGVTLSQAKLVTPEKSAAFAIEIARMLRDDKCEDVVCLDVRGRSPVTDYLVIGSGTSDRQMRSVLQHVEDYGAQSGNQCVRRSIDERATWILADFVDVVVHLFEPNTRAHYDLEMLWGDSKRVAWERPDQLSRDYAGLNN